MNLLLLVSLAALLVVLCTAWAKGFGRYTRRQRAHPPLAHLAPVFILCAGMISALRCAFSATPPEFALANLNEGAHDKAKLSYYADAAHAYRFLLVKPGTDLKHLALCGESDEPMALCTDQPSAAEDRVATIGLATAGETVLMVGSEAIAKDAWVYTAASGQVQDEPAIAGTYYRVGKAREACSAANVQFEVEPCAPIKLVVVAAFTSTNGTAAAASASLANLAAEAEKIGDDVRALGAALATPALVKVLT
jgi:hypothetical protein